MFLSRALEDEHVGLEETADGVWSVYFYKLLLAKLSEQNGRLYT